VQIESSDVSPTVAGDTVYACGNGTVMGFDTATGEERWRFETAEERPVTSQPAVVDGTLYVGTHGTATEGGRVYALTEP
jgi:outer membrane protein assembly factor BamB